MKYDDNFTLMDNIPSINNKHYQGDAFEDSISVVFPCFNEQHNIRHVYECASSVLQEMSVEHEIIIVDDGSTDATFQIAENIAAVDPFVRVIRHLTNRGYGAALKSGFRAATKNLIFYTDSDGQFDLGELPTLIPLARQYDIVSCFRLNRQDGLLRRVNAWCWTKLICYMFRIELNDINCAFKLYNHNVFREIEICSTGAFINAEILVRAIRRRYKIVQVGVHHFPRTSGRQTDANVAVIIRAFRELANFYAENEHL